MEYLPSKVRHEVMNAPDTPPAKHCAQPGEATRHFEVELRQHLHSYKMKYLYDVKIWAHTWPKHYIDSRLLKVNLG